MKTKTIKISEIVIDAGTQQRERINPEVVNEYAESIRCGNKFPPVVVFFDSVNYYLADGFHRVHAHDELEIDDIEAEINDGNLDDATLYSYASNKTHGLRRSQADKKKAVVGMISHPKFGMWTNRDIAKHIDVSHTYVNKLRDQLEEIESGNVSISAPKPTLNRDDGQKLSTGNEENHEEFDHKEHELQEAHDTISHLADENTKLRDALAAGQLPEDEIISAEETIAGLRKQVKSLEAEIDAVKSSRDIYQTENAQLKQQCRMYANKLKAFIS